MPNYELDNELKQLSGYVYKNNEFKIPQGWLQMSSSEDKKNGFYAETFVKGNSIVISFRGTDTKKYIPSKKDAANDFMMGAGMLPRQIVNADKLYHKTKKEFPNHKIILTGHSLGGSIAQTLGSRYGDETVTFGAYGTANLMDYKVENSDNIRNYGNANDPIFAANVQNQIGNTYVMDNYESNEGITQSRTGTNLDVSIDDFHGPDKMGDISKAVPYKGQNLQTEETLTLKAAIEENVDLRDVDPDRVLTREEISEMSTDEYINSEEFINQQLKSGKVMTKAEADEKIQSGAMVWVESYTRTDGTEVKGYYRAH